MGLSEIVALCVFQNRPSSMSSGVVKRCVQRPWRCGRNVRPRARLHRAAGRRAPAVDRHDVVAVAHAVAALAPARVPARNEACERGPTLNAPAPTLPTCATSCVSLGPKRPNSTQTWSNLGQAWPHSDKLWPTSPQAGRCQTRFGPMWAISTPPFANLAHTRRRKDPLKPTSSEHEPHSAPLRRTVPEFGSTIQPAA